MPERNYCLKPLVTAFCRPIVIRKLPPILAALVAILVVAIPLWIATYVWSDSVFMVDKKKCRNDCFDTIFKGPYESSVSKYKHVYFNCTSNSFKIWILTALGIIVLYETFKRIFVLAIVSRPRKIRWSMLFLFATSFHSNFYGWWMAWNYLNDEFYKQWYHQLFFSLTELITTSIVVYYMDSNTSMRPIPLVLVANISLFHMWASGTDQFVLNVLFQTGKPYQVVRDLFLMQSDLFHTAFALYFLRNSNPSSSVNLTLVSNSKANNYRTSLLCTKKYILIIVVTTVIMYLTLKSVPNLDRK